MATRKDNWTSFRIRQTKTAGSLIAAPAVLSLALGLSCGSALAQSADEGVLTPRQIYKSPQNTPTPAQRAPRRPVRPGPESSARSRTSETETVDAPVRRSNEKPAIVQPEPATGLPLVLRYAIRQVGPDGKTRDVNPTSTFRSGDRVKLALESSEPAYLYVLQDGSDGEMSVLYPESGQHRLRARSAVEIPAGRLDFKFDDTAGTERLLVILSRKPETDTEKLIDRLQQSHRPAVDKPGSDKGGRTMMAAGKAPEADVIRTRLRSRNLRIEERPRTEDGRTEEAVYIADDSTTDPGQSFMAEIVLKHQ